MKNLYFYNISYTVDIEIFEQWLEWFNNQHLTEILENSDFTQALLLAVEVNDHRHKIHSLQLSAENLSVIKEFQEQTEMKLRHKMYMQFGEKAVAFATPLRIISVIKKEKK